jgi:hypothetical protein
MRPNECGAGVAHIFTRLSDLSQLQIAPPLYVLFGVSADLTRLRNVGHSLRLHMKRLFCVSATLDLPN